MLDDSSVFRMNPEVPLVVPEVNAGDLNGVHKIIAIPNCVTVPLVMALYPLHKENSIRRVVVCTYQSISGSGTKAMDGLTAETSQCWKVVWLSRLSIPIPLVSMSSLK